MARAIDYEEARLRAAYEDACIERDIFQRRSPPAYRNSIEAWFQGAQEVSLTINELLKVADLTERRDEICAKPDRLLDEMRAYWATKEKNYA